MTTSELGPNCTLSNAEGGKTQSEKCSYSSLLQQADFSLKLIICCCVHSSFGTLTFPATAVHHVCKCAGQQQTVTGAVLAHSTT